MTIRQFIRLIGQCTGSEFLSVAILFAGAIVIASIGG